MSTLVAAAAWLASEVGEGGVFTKSDLRMQFPDVAQIDRRVRDLRACGWVIHTRREDPMLRASEMRVVKIGGTRRLTETLSSNDRRAALLRSAYACVFCGAQGGTTYPDAKHVRVVLQVIAVDGVARPFATCTRCRDTGHHLPAESSSSLGGEVEAAASLSPSDWSAACRMRLTSRLGEV